VKDLLVRKFREVFSTGGIYVNYRAFLRAMKAIEHGIRPEDVQVMMMMMYDDGDDDDDDDDDDYDPCASCSSAITGRKSLPAMAVSCNPFLDPLCSLQDTADYRFDLRKDKAPPQIHRVPVVEPVTWQQMGGTEADVLMKLKKQVRAGLGVVARVTC
jgi:hypothetical protein